MLLRYNWVLPLIWMILQMCPCATANEKTYGVLVAEDNVYWKDSIKIAPSEKQKLENLENLLQLVSVRLRQERSFYAQLAGYVKVLKTILLASL